MWTFNPSGSNRELLLNGEEWLIRQTSIAMEISVPFFATPLVNKYWHSFRGLRKGNQVD